MANNEETKQKIDIWHFEEGQWIDGIIRQIYPDWFIWIADKLARRYRLLRFILSKFYGIEIKRSQDTEIRGMNQGFRRNAPNKIKAITTSVVKKGKTVAQRTWKLDLIIPNNFSIHG